MPIAVTMGNEGTRAYRGRAVRWLAAILAFACACAFPGWATASARGKVPTILFVGNSFVHGNVEPVRSYGVDAVADENYGLPIYDPRFHWGAPWGGVAAIFKTFTREAGLTYDVHVELVSASSLRFHYEHALEIIAQSKWDLIVLQEVSTGPILQRDGHDPAQFRRYTDLLERAIHRASPAAKIVLYETFPRADLTYPPGAPYRGKGIEAMGHALHAAYFREAEHAGIAGVAPVGDAWLRAIREGAAEANPYVPEPQKIDLWAADNFHPSAWGAYLAACVFFERITGRDVRDIGAGERAAAALGVAPAQARTLQRIAHETRGDRDEHRSSRASFLKSIVPQEDRSSRGSFLTSAVPHERASIARDSPATAMPAHGDVPSQ